MSQRGHRTRQKPNVRQFEGICGQCGIPFRGRVDKRYCRDACRTAFGRDRKAREHQDTISRLSRLAGVHAP